MLSRDFKEFVESLNAHHVEYLVVGGYALAAHGRPRYTGDLDIWLRATPENVQRVLLSLADFGFASLGLKAADFLAPDSVIQLGYPPGRIDLLTGVDGVDFDACYPRRIEVAIAGTTLPFISLEDLKVNKRAAGRLQDLADLQSLDEPDADGA